MGSGTPTPPPRQYPSNFAWSQQVPGDSSTPQVALSQQSMMICPGQPGLSQQAVDLSQPTATPGPSWQPQRAPMTTPRPVAHGCGMAGMMHQFPPVKQTWPRPSQYSQNTPTPPRTPSQPGLGTTPTRTPSTRDRTISGRIPSNQMRKEFYDNQKVNGLPLPRAIRSSSWSQLKDIEGCDPLTVPLSKLLYQGSENFWLRKLATGREVYVATMGEVSQVVFVSEILAQVRGRGIDLDRLSQNKALQDGLTVDKKEAIQHLTKLLLDQMQKWLPVVQADSGSQHQIAALQAEIAALKAKTGSPAQQEAPAPEGNTPTPPNRVQSPIEAAFQGHRPVAFDPAQLLVAPGGTNQWLENNMPESFSDTKYKTWFKTLKLDIKSRQTIERNIVAMDTWWQNQPEAAEATIHRVAVCLGISPGKIKSGHNENLLKVMTVALTMTS